jgi:hypothetical protein
MVRTSVPASNRWTANACRLSREREFVVLLFDDFPIKRPGQDRLKVGVFFRFPLFRPVEPLLSEVL